MGKHTITATIYDKKGKILSKGINNYTRTHPLQAKFATQVGQPARVFLHAELSALIKLPPGSQPWRISVSRYKKDGTTGNSSPCMVCRAALKHWGIAVIEHTL